ncbi:MAG TPA: 5-formyltetrahydrofolate cyclo-ligase [Pilimelia sp.]|nr:5-formyltetrahydrofolate cyclo-ligase [Pilimelia sp.]
MSSSATDAKAALRARVLAARRSRSAASQLAGQARVRASLVDLVRHQHVHLAAAYVPVGGEPGGAELPDVLAAALAPAGRLLLPVLRPDLDLDWAQYTGPGTLVAAGRGLREPGGPRLGPAAIRAAMLVVVPALAVDRAGRRLGRGGGSYDRALARTDPAALTVALLHDGEIVDAVPAEPHDQPVRAVITPSEGLRLLS